MREGVTDVGGVAGAVRGNRTRRKRNKGASVEIEQAETVIDAWLPAPEGLWIVHCDQI